MPEPKETIGHFTPSPTKLIRFVDSEGKVVKQVRMNRKQRRAVGIRGGNYA